ncbi:DUF3164 family protein [Providencia rettgeri]
MLANDKQFTTHEVPEGFWINAKGHNVPLKTIKQIDRLRDALVGDIVTPAKALNQALKDLKTTAFNSIDAFRELSAEQFDAPVGGEKGNVKLYAFDGEHCIQVAIQDRMAFDERLQTAKTLIDECIFSWSEGANPNILAIINDAFQVDKEGKIRIREILSLRRLDIQDDKWLKAMDAISESIQIVDSCRYIRIYERTGDSNKYIQISLNITGV